MAPTLVLRQQCTLYVVLRILAFREHPLRITRTWSVMWFFRSPIARHISLKQGIWQVCWFFFQLLRFLPPINCLTQQGIAEILLKVVLDTHNHIFCLCLQFNCFVSSQINATCAGIFLCLQFKFFMLHRLLNTDDIVILDSLNYIKGKNSKQCFR